MSDAVGADRAPHVDVIPLGGLGEFGMNMLIVACGETAVLIDAGVMFPEPEAFGGCSSAGQSRPEQPQPIHIVRKHGTSHQPGAQA